MTDTYYLLNKGKIDPDNKYEMHYVTYTTPSPEDKNWDLQIHLNQDEAGELLEYDARYSWSPDPETYPIFDRLAMTHTWQEAQCLHPDFYRQLVGVDLFSMTAYDRCTRCNELVMGLKPLTPGRYNAMSAPRTSTT